MRFWTHDVGSDLSARAATVVALGAIYFLAGKFELDLAFLHPGATVVWAPTGIALAALLVVGTWVWPGILLGAFLLHLTTEATPITALGIALGTVLEGVTGSYLVGRFAGGRRAFERVRTVFAFALLAAVLSTTVGATLGVTSLALGGFAAWSHYESTWLSWWLGDVAGTLIVTPAIVLWSEPLDVRWSLQQRMEAVVLLLSLVATALIVFGGMVPAGNHTYPLAFLCVPYLLWAGFRFGPRGAATAVLTVAVIAILGTVLGWGPIAQVPAHESLLTLQAFMAVTAVMSLTVAASTQERLRVESQFRDLAVRDGLTGLLNYRGMANTVNAETLRAQRMQRTFALLLLDLDGLKSINDRFGHVVGSEAICRVANALRASCRAIDSTARYGGDEFAIVLPESNAVAALSVAARVTQRLTADGGEPPITVSVGIAEFPRDGEAFDALLDAADRRLYRAKADSASRSASSKDQT